MCSQWLASIRDQLPSDFSEEDSEAFHEALKQEAMRRFGDFLAGVKAYQTCPVARDVPNAPCVWEDGTTRLLDYARGSDASVILVVPSLVNRFDILDLDKDRSFLRFLVSSGYRPLVVDWGVPGSEENSFSIQDYMNKRLEPILAFAASEGKPIHLVGYCMGGLFSVALALMQPALVKSLALLATPWDFAGGVGGVPGCSTSVGRLFMKQASNAQECLAEIGFLPASFMQSVFTSFQPLSILQKFSGFAGVEADSDVARYFSLTEDWLNDGVPLALPVSQECLSDWYADNLPVKGKWKIGDLLIDPSKLTIPTFVLAAKRDQIVPSESALPLVDMIPDVTLHAPDIGHIGLMVSSRAKTLAWEPFTDWLNAH